MARQTGLVKYEGTMGGIRHYRLKGRNEWYASMKSGPTREQVLKSSAFERTRETMREFGGVAKAAGAFRNGVGALKKRLGDACVNQRIVKRMYSIMRKDRRGARGKRVVEMSKRGLDMAGFEWNAKMSLGSALSGKIEVNWQNERKASVKIEGGSFSAPKGATHARIVVVMHTVSDLRYDEVGHQMFKNGGGVRYAVKWSEYTSVDEAVNEEIRVELAADADLKDCGVFVSVGVEFYEEAGDYYYAMREGGCMRTLSAYVEEKEDADLVVDDAVENASDGEIVTDKEDRFYGRARFKKE